MVISADVFLRWDAEPYNNAMKRDMINRIPWKHRKTKQTGVLGKPERII